MLIAFLAYLYVVYMGLLFESRTPALTVYQVRLLLMNILPLLKLTGKAAIRVVRIYQRGYFTAYLSH